MTLEQAIQLAVKQTIQSNVTRRMTMSWYLFVKYLHIIAVAVTTGGMFARQLIRGIAKKSDNIKTVESLTQAVHRMDRTMIIPGSGAMLVFGIILAIMLKWPIFGFLQGADKNWLLVSNILLVIMNFLIPGVFIPHNKKVAGLLQTALTEGRVTTELSSTLNDKKNQLAHHAEEIIILVVAALMVLKPF
jgi:uncharacterized membrane protein